MDGRKRRSGPKKGKRRSVVQEDIDPNCICNREIGVFLCRRCHQFHKGRLSLTCPVHPKTIYLMDIRGCPYCFGPITLLEESTEAEMIRCEGELPIDDDDW